MLVDYKSGLIEAKLDRTKKVLANDINFSLAEGETVALIGETGSGKTIIACSLMKILPENVIAHRTKFIFDNVDLSYKKNITKLLGREIVYIPQSGFECLNPSRTIKKHLDDSLKRNGINKAKWEQISEEILLKVGFTSPHLILTKYPFELSGGMAQKVTIALASIAKPKLIIADEMTNGLDNSNKYEIISLLNSLFPSSAKLFITHDISIARFSTRCLVLSKGQLMEEGPTEAVLSKPYHPYTKALLDALVENGLNPRLKLRDEKGTCPFYSRCQKVNEKCLTPLINNKKEERSWWCNNV